VVDAAVVVIDDVVDVVAVDAVVGTDDAVYVGCWF
jgi:hypothetical protein